MWILLDELTFWTLAILGIGFFMLLAVLIVVGLKMPRSAKTILLTWLMKGVVTIEATKSNTLRFVRRINTPTGLRAKIGKQTSVKTVPQTVNPILSSPAFLEGTGIPVYLAAEDLALALTPNSALATQIATSPNKEELPEYAKEFAKKSGVSMDQLEDMLHLKRPGPELKEGEDRSEMFPLDLRNISKLSLFNIGDLEAARRNMLEWERMEGKREGMGERSSTVKFAPILIIIIGVMGFLLLILFMSGGGVPTLGI